MTDEDGLDGIDKDVGDNRRYFQGRADWHRARARIASDAGSRMLHDRFAMIYEARARGE